MKQMRGFASGCETAEREAAQMRKTGRSLKAEKIVSQGANDYLWYTGFVLLNTRYTQIFPLHLGYCKKNSLVIF
jgi:hypothetical protein